MAISSGGPALELLYLRSVWGLDVPLDWPATSPEPRRGSAARPAVEEAATAERWMELFNAWDCDLGSTGDAGWWGVRYGTAGFDHDARREWLLAVKSSWNRDSPDVIRARGDVLSRWQAGRGSGTPELWVLPLAGVFGQQRTTRIVLSFGSFREPDVLEAALGGLESPS
ncbi:MAG TPA: hypothetical protein DHV14_11195 [Micrococcales bacterium]|nr:hypothetical protein [Micrococcales bacterium]